MKTCGKTQVGTFFNSLFLLVGMFTEGKWPAYWQTTASNSQRATRFLLWQIVEAFCLFTRRLGVTMLSYHHKTVFALSGQEKWISTDS
jgi:hypothetical protein